jgi:hypothetical protein
MRFLASAIAILAASWMAIGCSMLANVSSLSSGGPRLDEKDDDEDANAARDEEKAEKKEEPADAAPSGPLRFTGTLAKTDEVTFGGAGYCDYRVAATAVTVELAVDGRIVSADVKDTMVEEVLGTCPYPATAPATEHYVLAEAESTGNTLVMKPAEASSSSSVLTLEAAPSGSRYDLTLTWKHSGTGPSALAWTVTGTVSVMR